MILVNSSATSNFGVVSLKLGFCMPPISAFINRTETTEDMSTGASLFRFSGLLLTNYFRGIFV